MNERGSDDMELAKVTSKGQITIPVEIRTKLGIKEGDKVLFVEEGNRIFMVNSTLMALKEAQDSFQGEAERVGLKDEQDVVDLIRQMRKDDGK